MNADYLLIRGAKRGNAKAAEAIIRKYYANVFDYCKYHSADIHTAEDITQEVFLTFIKEIHRYKHQGKLLNFLYTIARNKCIDEKKKMRNADVSTECVMKELEAKPVGIEGETDYLMVKEAVENLSNEVREVIVMYYYLGLKQKEIAEICGIGLSLVKYRLRQGKELIRIFMEGES